MLAWGDDRRALAESLANSITRSRSGVEQAALLEKVRPRTSRRQVGDSEGSVSPASRPAPALSRGPVGGHTDAAIPGSILPADSCFRAAARRRTLHGRARDQPPKPRNSTPTLKGFHHTETTRTWDALYYGDVRSIRFYDQAVARMLDRIQARSGDRVLDAGCGAGVHAIRAARHGCQVDAIDFSQAALDDASTRARSAGLAERIRFSRDDLTRLSFADAAYTKIFSWGVLIHIPEIEKAMDELVRILAPGGRLALYVSNSQALQLSLARVKRRLLGRPHPAKPLPMGLGMRVEFHDEQIWVWFNDVEAIVRYLAARGLRLLSREAGEFCDFHIRHTGWLRQLFVGLNRFWCDARLPARFAHMNLLVFEKSATAGTPAPAVR